MGQSSAYSEFLEVVLISDQRSRHFTSHAAEGLNPLYCAETTKLEEEFLGCSLESEGKLCKKCDF